MADVKQDVITGILKYKPVKYLITTILSILVIMFIYTSINHLYRCSHSLNSKYLWGLHECEECKVLPVKTEILYKDTCINNTLVSDKQKEPSLKHFKPPTIQKTDNTVAKTKIDSNKDSKYNFQNPTFNSPVQIGDGNTQNNNFDKPARHFSTDALTQIASLNPKHLPIEVWYYTNTPEAATFALELIEGLQKNGYKLTSRRFFSMVPEKFPKETDLKYAVNDTIFQLTVYPQISPN